MSILTYIPVKYKFNYSILRKSRHGQRGRDCSVYVQAM